MRRDMGLNPGYFQIFQHKNDNYMVPCSYFYLMIIIYFTEFYGFN